MTGWAHHSIGFSRARQAVRAAARFGTFAAFAVQAGLWVTGYYPQYEQYQMPVSQIDFTTVTHAIHFSVTVNSDGTIDAVDNGLTAAACSQFVNKVHQSARKALLCVGGAGSESSFEGATTSASLPAFVAALASFVSTNDYDGLDIDWEPITDGDVTQYSNFVIAIRAALPGKLLTVAAPAYAESGMYASLQGDFDQINIMTYELSGPWPGWVTWFNSPIQDGGYRFASTGGLVPSINGAVSNAEAAGVAPAKLGIGLPFYGYVWTGGPGVTQPRQSWNATNPPITTASTYQSIVSGYYRSNSYHWDTSADAAYLSITNIPATNDMFVSYDDTQACEAKVSYVRNERLGGIMIWELSQDYNSGAPSGQQQPLLAAVKQSLATPQMLSNQDQNGQLTFAFSTLPLALYRILWTSNLSDGTWNTLTNNVPGSGSPAIFTDSPSNATRFYRIQTPP